MAEEQLELPAAEPEEPATKQEPVPEITNPEEPILPYLDEADFDAIQKKFEEALETSEALPDVEIVKYYLENPDTLTDTFTLEQRVLLVMLMRGDIGTSSQRGSITRILNTLELKYICKPDPGLVKGLNQILSRI